MGDKGIPLEGNKDDLSDEIQKRRGSDESDLTASERRSKAACNRCKKRKTKCSGTFPCRTCSASGDVCEYYRKPKKILVLDTELDGYKDRIEELTRELRALKQRKNQEDSIPSVLGENQKQNGHLKLSVWLGSASCELVCWNLKQLSGADVTQIKELVVSPDFDLSLEENSYDELLVRKQSDFPTVMDDMNDHLSSLDINKLEKSLSNVVLFINSGYLIIDPLAFMSRVKPYFEPDGGFKQISMSADNVDIFVLKLLMILSLGEVYSEDSCIGKQNETFVSVPGSKYFSIVVNCLSMVFTLIHPLPSISESLEVIELFGLISLYLRIMDKKNLAVILTLNALQICISLNLHKASSNNNILDNRSHASKVFWTTYCLNRFYTSRIGQPLLMDVEEITTEYPEAYNFSLSRNNKIPKTIYEYGNSKTMKFYIDLAMISERICKELYSSRNKFNNQAYLTSMFSILESLAEWANRIPSYLRIKLSEDNKFDESSRLIYTLNLNYLHHIYLTCIPVLLHFSKIKLQSIRSKKGYYNPFKLKELPKNISSLIVSCIVSSQETIKIFMSLHKERFIRSFGFVDLDYLFSSSLILTICMILKVQLPESGDSYSFEDYLEVAINLMNEMSLMGNLVAKAKLNQTLDLLSSLHNYFVDAGSGDFISRLSLLRRNGKTHDGKRDAGIKRARASTVDQVISDPQLEMDYFISSAQDSGFSSSLFDLNSNTILDEFDIGRDIINIDEMGSSNFYSMGSDDLYRLTEEDMLFVDNIMQNIPNDE